MSDLFKCFELHCTGTVQKANIKYELTLNTGEIFVINDLPAEKCDKCGEVLFDANACRLIDEGIEAAHPGYFEKARERRRNQRNQNGN